MRAALRAERLKLRRTGVAWLPLFGLFFGLLQGGLFVIGPGSVLTWPGIIAWHTLWITFLSPLVLALLAGLTALREARARGGGTWWRPVSPLTLHLAEFAGLAALALSTTALVVFSSVLVGEALRLPGLPPLGRLLSLTVTLWLASLPIVVLYQGTARWLGLFGSLVFGLVGTVSGVSVAEGATWWLNPWAWPVRATLALSGTHANGVPLEPGSPMWNLDVWPVLALALVTTPALLLLGAHVPRARPRLWRHYRQDAVSASRRGYPRSALGSEWVKSRHTVLPWLTLVIPFLFTFIAVWYGVSSAWQLWALLVLPFGAALLPTVAWSWETDAWRVLKTRPVSVARLYTAKLVALWLHANASAAFLAVLLWVFGLWVFGLGVFGLESRTLVRLLALHAGVSFLLLTFHLLLAVRFGVGVSLGTGAVLTLLALLFGGTGLGDAVWLFFPWVWAWSPVAAGVSVLPFTVLAVLVGLFFGWLGARVAARFVRC